MSIYQIEYYSNRINMNEIDIRLLFGKNLKRLRKNKNLSQLDFANKVDVSFTFVSDIENGRKWVSPETLSKFSEALEVEVFQFFLPESFITPPSADIKNFSNDLQEAFNKIKLRYSV